MDAFELTDVSRLRRICVETLPVSKIQKIDDDTGKMIQERFASFVQPER
jgi:hypothetical protein